MSPELSEWIAKAEEDFRVMQRESRVRTRPSYNAICFHAQQCSEKYLKARLLAGKVAFQKLHHLVILLDQVLPLEPEWERFRLTLAQLTAYAVTFRYPGESATPDMAVRAVRACRAFRLAARRSLLPERARPGTKAARPKRRQRRPRSR